MKRFFILSVLIIFLGAGCSAGSMSSNNDGGVFKTVNAGEEWFQTIVVPTASGIGTLATTDVLNMEIDPQDRSFIYLGSRQNGMLYSDDSGASWRQPRIPALRDGLIFKVEVDPKDICHVLVAKGQRLYSTQDCMRTFDSETYIENRTGVNVIQAAIDWYDNTIIWVGLSNGDVLYSDDSGNSWKTVLTTRGEISGFLINNNDSRKVLVSTYNNGIYKTEDGGQNWKKVGGNLDKFDGADRVFSMIQTDNSNVVVTANAYGLLRSMDFGSSWEPISLVTSPKQVVIRAIGMDPNNSANLFYATNGTFYSSNDSGSTWKTERLATSRVPRAMLVDPENPATIYIGVATSTEK